MTILEQIHGVVDTMPEATKAEGMKAAFSLGEAMLKGDPRAEQCICELLGAVGTGDDPKLRKVLVWMNEHGPIVRAEVLPT